MTPYFDTSFIAPLIQPSSSKTEAFLAKLPPADLYISHGTCVEFASLVAREVRMGGLPEPDAFQALSQFDELVAESFQLLVPGPLDYELAKGYLRHFATQLRAGDALHLAVARNQGAKMLYTLDEGLLHAATLLKVQASRGIPT